MDKVLASEFETIMPLAGGTPHAYMTDHSPGSIEGKDYFIAVQDRLHPGDRIDVTFRTDAGFDFAIYLVERADREGAVVRQVVPQKPVSGTTPQVTDMTEGRAGQRKRSASQTKKKEKS